MSPKPLNFGALKTVPLAQRKSENDEADFCAPFNSGSSFSDFLCSLPNLGASAELFALRDAIVSAHRHGKSVVIGCGAHVIASGLSPLLIRLMEKRLVSAIALTGAAMLQDVEIALSGHTVKTGEADFAANHFSVTEETGRLINEAINFGVIENWGLGESVGKKLNDSEPEHLEHSILATATRYNIPATVHPAIGADAFNLHPAARGESLGAAGMHDARLLAAVVAESSDGVLLTIASGVIIPQVFLLAADAARNLGKKVEKLTAAMIDANANALPVTTIVDRLSQPGGRSIYLQGPDELLLPLLFAAVVDALGDSHAQ